jgi:dihydroflavonol-4-reductase
MKVFVTGGTGFIGTHFIKRMAQTDHELRCLCRKTSNVSCLKEAGMEMFVGNVSDKDSLLEGMKGCDWVVNLANVYSFWEPDKRVFTDVNVTGTRNVMESALQAGASKVVHTSTVLVYDAPHEGQNAKETDYYKSCKSEYGRTKYLADSICWGLYEKEGLPLVMIYPGGVLGEGNTKASRGYIETVAGKKSPFTVYEDTRTTYVYVKDVAEAILKALEKPDNIGEKYPVGNATLSYGELNKMISDVSGTSLPKMSLPGSMAKVNAMFTTWIADAIKKPPILGMCKDSIGQMSRDCTFDGSKTERELGLEYTPIRIAVEEEVNEIRAGAGAAR